MPLLEQFAISGLNFVDRSQDAIRIRLLGCHKTGTAAMLLIEQGIIEIKQDYPHDSTSSTTSTVFFNFSNWYSVYRSTDLLGIETGCAPLWECLRSEPCGEPCYMPSSAGNRVTMELAELMTAWPLLCVACGLAWLSADPKQVQEKLGTCRTDELKSRLGLDDEAES